MRYGRHFEGAPKNGRENAGVLFIAVDGSDQPIPPVSSAMFAPIFDTLIHYIFTCVLVYGITAHCSGTNDPISEYLVCSSNRTYRTKEKVRYVRCTTFYMPPAMESVVMVCKAP